MDTEYKCEDPNCEHIYGKHNIPHGASVSPQDLQLMIIERAKELTGLFAAHDKDSDIFTKEEKISLAGLDDCVFSLLLGDQADEDPLNDAALAGKFLEMLITLSMKERQVLLISLLRMATKKGWLLSENGQRNEIREQNGEKAMTLLDELKGKVTAHGG